jgi:hypothetical protein
MNSRRLREESYDLSAENGAAFFSYIEKRRCWLDGNECPYGQPEGQFRLRPRQFCQPSNGKMSGSGCRVIDDNLAELEDLITRAMLESMKERIEEATTTISDELESLADQTKDESLKGALKLIARSLVEGKDDLCNRDIVLLEDLELEK